MSSAVSVQTYKESFKNRSRVLGNVNFENQVFGIPALKRFMEKTIERLARVRETLAGLEEVKGRYIRSKPAEFHEVACLETKTMVKKPVPYDMGTYYDEESDQYFDSTYMDKVNRSKGERSVLLSEIAFCRETLGIKD